MGKIPFILATGFLGSGKTTFLKELIKQHGNSLNIAVIQNEFAPARIDGTDIKTEFDNIDILELNRGSVFCLCMLSDFVKQAAQFIDKYKPDLIILEASGLSDPIAIAEVIQMEPLSKYVYLDKIWTIVDASQFCKLVSVNLRVQHQVCIADEVIINKTDLSTPENINLCIKKVNELNPYASVKQAEYCYVQNLVLNTQTTPHAVKHSEINKKITPEGNPNINIAVFKKAAEMPNFNPRSLANKLQDNIIRLKGYIKLSETKTVAVQASYSQFSFKEIENYKGISELILIGGDISPREFKTIVEEAI